MGEEEGASEGIGETVGAAVGLLVCLVGAGVGLLVDLTFVVFTFLADVFFDFFALRSRPPLPLLLVPHSPSWIVEHGYITEIIPTTDGEAL